MFDHLDDIDAGGELPYGSSRANAAPNPFAPISAAERLNAIPSSTGKHMAPMRALRPGDAYGFQPYEQVQNTYKEYQPQPYWEQSAPYAAQQDPFLAQPTNDYFTDRFMPQMPQYQQDEPLFEQTQSYQPQTQLPHYLQSKEQPTAQPEEPAVPSQMRWDGTDFVADQEDLWLHTNQGNIENEGSRIVSTFEMPIDEAKEAEPILESPSVRPVRRSRVARNAQTYQREDEGQSLYYPLPPEYPTFDMQNMANDLNPPMMPTSEDQWAMDAFEGEAYDTPQEGYESPIDNMPVDEESRYTNQTAAKPQQVYFASSEFRSDSPVNIKRRSGSYHQVGEQLAGLRDAFEPAQADTPPLFQADVQQVQSKMQKQVAKPMREISHGIQAKPALNISRVIVLVLGVALFLFCVIGGVKFAINVMNNQEEVKQFKQGNVVGSNTDVVVLPPAGQTFAPTVTPAPQMGIVQKDAQMPDAEVTAETEDTANRSKINSYPSNPLGNVLESMMELFANYPNVVGRLTIEGVLDEVVVQKNNIYYLTHDYKGATSDSGAVYMDESCSIKMPPENLLLRGQSDFDGEVFAPLANFGNQEYVTGKTRATLSTLYEEAQYVLFAVIRANNNSSNAHYFNYASQPTFLNDAEMTRYVEKVRSYSLFQFNVEVTPTDRLLTLATISSKADESIVLIYRMLRANEASR